jgi:hypothetical protein
MPIKSGFDTGLLYSGEPQLPQKPLSLCAPLSRSAGFANWTANPHRVAAEHHDRRVSGAGVALAVATLAMEASNGLGSEIVADFAAATTVGVGHLANLPVARHEPSRPCRLDLAGSLAARRAAPAGLNGTIEKLYQLVRR